MIETVRQVPELIRGALAGFAVGASVAVFHVITESGPSPVDSLVTGVLVGLGLAVLSGWLRSEPRR